MDHQKSKFSLSFRIIAGVLLQIFLFVNCAYCGTDILSTNKDTDRTTLSPSVKISEISVRDLFSQASVSINGDMPDVQSIIRNPNRLFNSTFIRDIALNPSLMSNIKQADFKQAMLKVLRSKSTALKIPYLMVLDSFFLLDKDGVVDNQILNELANIISRDKEKMETRLRAQKALAAIAIRNPELKSQAEELIVTATNDRIAILKQRKMPFHFLSIQATEALFNMGADTQTISMIEKTDVDLARATHYLRGKLSSMVSYIESDQRRQGKNGRVVKISSKQNSFTDGIWLFGSDIDGFVIQLEDISIEEMQRYERLFDNLLLEIGVAGADDALDKPHWKTRSSEAPANDSVTAEIVLLDRSSQLEEQNGSLLKNGWPMIEGDFRTEKSKLRKIFIDLLNTSGDAMESLDKFLVKDLQFLSDSDRDKINTMFSDPDQANRVRALLSRMHFIMAMNKIFYKSNKQVSMVVDNFYETLDDLRMLEKIADDAGDQLIRVREISTDNNSKEFHVYPLWFMYTKGAQRESLEGIRLVDRNSEKQIAIDRDVFILPIENDGSLSDARVSSLAEVKSFVGANKLGLFDVENQTITLIESNSLGYSLAASNDNLRVVFFDANGDITLLAESKKEAVDFMSLIGKVDIFASLLDKDKMLVVQDAESRTDFIEPQKFSSFIEKQEFVRVDPRIEMIPSGEETAITPNAEQLSEFVGSEKQVIFDVVSGKIILVQDSWLVNSLIQNNENYRYFFFDGNGDISLFVNSLKEAQMFETIISSAKIFSQILDLDRSLIVKNIETFSELKDPVEFFALVGKDALAIQNQKADRVTDDVKEFIMNNLQVEVNRIISSDTQLIDEAI